MKRAWLTFLLILFMMQSAHSQSMFNEFIGLSRPEKWWVIMHPFIAKKASEAAKKARIAAKRQRQNPALDSIYNGGRIDAFKHAYWMALMVREMKSKKAKKLGIAHEKGNYLDFKKHRGEDGALPTKENNEMDLYNNMAGLKIGRKFNEIPEDSLQDIIIDSIMVGYLKVIKHNEKGDFLDSNGNIILPANIKGIWKTPRVLVPSAYGEKDQ